MASLGLKRKTFAGVSITTLALIISDLAAFFCAFIFALLLRTAFPGFFLWPAYFDLIPFLLCFPGIFALMRLYPGIFLQPAEELKYLSIATSAVFLLLAGIFFLLKSADVYSRFFFLAAWVSSLIFVPTFRYALRRYCHQKHWWQIPVVMIAHPSIMKESIQCATVRSRFTGFRLEALLIPEHSADPVSLEACGKEFLGKQSFFEGTAGPELVKTFPVNSSQSLEEEFGVFFQHDADAVVILHLPSIPKAQWGQLIDRISLFCRRLLLLPGKDSFPCLPEEIVHLGDFYGLTVKRNLADPRRLLLKRILDIFFTICLILPLMPLIFIIALAIMLDSKGPIFFWQQRIGRDGKAFFICKFRTMAVNASDLLNSYLKENPVACHEWETTQKLRFDPRITRVGHFLRQSSLDELPQFINIFRGEMSLVGPRPIVASEIEKYQEKYILYTRCLPGITGLWQISGRSDTSYARRVDLDGYYINNWSVWLDIYILLRTIPVVLLRKGAY